MQQRLAIPAGLRAILLAILGGATTAGADALVAQDQQADGRGQQPVNRLAKESSPYLRLHRHNPVDWHPWGPEALQLAKKLDKPIFLSIGYSACHWCHVMARESFEDPAVAALMNDKFVCIKVDREERPDVDEIYMAALQAMGRRGGWPLSMWMTPDARPFFGGTYFPPEDAGGRPSFRRVCEAMAKAFSERREDVQKGAAELSEHLQQSLSPDLPPGEPTPSQVAALLPALAERFDAEFGGFGQAPAFAPKFPQPCELAALLRIDGDDAWQMAAKTLHAMRKGGMHDQLGGGFHRYSTDRQWHVPHFEKMLYDNAQLAQLYLDAHLRSGEQVFADVARTTLDYVLREMQSPAGGFWSTQDAQSEGVEGKFFVWQRAEFDALLGERADAVAGVFGVTDPPNWELGNVLHLTREAPTTVAFRQARQQLFEARSQRIAPATDDKILAGWNGLMLGAMASGYRVLGEQRYLEAAQRAAAFLLDRLERDGRVTRSWQGEAARHRGCLDDHAGLADGLLSVFEADGDPRWLAAARRILRSTVAHFRAEDGNFYYTADDHEALLARTRSPYDGATPSGISLVTRALLRAGLLLGDTALYGHGVDALRANHAVLERAPSAVALLVQAVHFHTGAPKEVVVVGAPDDERTRALLQAAWRQYPAPCVVASLHDGNREALTGLSPIFRDKPLLDGAPVAYVCERGSCQAPTSDPQVLLRQIAAR